MNNVVLVCYDISNNKLRRRIDKTMKDFGVRLQFSVFLCRLDANGLGRCRDKLRKVVALHKNETSPGDSLIVFDQVSPTGADCLLGMQIAQKAPRFGIL